MNGSKVIAELLGDAAQVVDVWTANPSFSMGTVTLPDLQAAMADLQTTHAAVESTRTLLTGQVDVRNDKAKVVSDLVTRARSGIRAQFGPDSPQYEQTGGTRRSERKPPHRQPKAATAA